MGTHVKYVNPKLSTSCIAMRTGNSLMMTDTLKLIPFVFSEPELSGKEDTRDIIPNSLFKVNPTSKQDIAQS